MSALSMIGPAASSRTCWKVQYRMLAGLNWPLVPLGGLSSLAAGAGG